MKSFYFTVLLLCNAKALHYIPYKQIRPLFLEMYHIINPKNFSLEHVVPQSLFKKKNTRNISRYA